MLLLSLLLPLAFLPLLTTSAAVARLDLLAIALHRPSFHGGSLSLRWTKAWVLIRAPASTAAVAELTLLFLSFHGSHSPHSSSAFTGVARPELRLNDSRGRVRVSGLSRGGRERRVKIGVK